MFLPGKLALLICYGQKRVEFSKMSDADDVRIDKWLWAARFFKTRQLASEAVNGGKVHINGQRCKPGKDVKVGDKISISKDHYTWDIQVTDINRQRRPAKEASLLYIEDEASQRKRQAQIELQKEQQALMPVFERECRPNKKQRRQIHKFRADSY
jgi:ribosome-associated heat shock protein Hsp15